MSRFVVLCLACLYSTSVVAQTEEQTVAFIVGGIEAGKTVGSLCGERHQPEILGATPARYRWRCKDGITVDLVIRKVANCKYEWLEGGPKDEPVTLDFNSFQKLLPPNPKHPEDHFFLASPGFCNPKRICSGDFFMSVNTGSCCTFRGDNTPYQRREAAINHLFKTYCGRGAF
jgi:hypothetical protein